jgi:hypothetical protein
MSVDPWQELENLVVVAGHAVYVAEDFSAPTADDSWYLQDNQKGEPPFYVEHIREGVRLAAEDKASLLVFSGGQSRAAAGPQSEAFSYWRMAKHFQWWHHADLEPRVTTEEYARDSFENVLFSICRFYECVGRVPKRIRLISWAFKEPRFAMHRQAIRFPAERFELVGVGNPVDLKSAEEGEQKAVVAFKAEPYGTGGRAARIRAQRDPFRRTPRYVASCAPLAGLLRHQGPELYDLKLPW